MSNEADAVNIPAIKIAVLNMRESLPVIMEMNELDAKIKRSKFVALVHEGFTEEQALVLVK